MNFKGIIGHRRNIEQIKKLINDGRLPHAMLFCGPEGVGKRMTAVALAAFSNCEDPRPEGACGNCMSCIKLKAGSHPLIRFIGSSKDEPVMEVEFRNQDTVLISNIIPVKEDGSKKETKKISINQIRDIIRYSSLKAYGAKKKIFIIDDVANSSKEALNSLLKILEEPPEDTYFMLVTSKEESLLPTVLSRCSRIVFGSLSPEDMELFAAGRIPAESGLDAEKTAELLRISSGIPGRMLSYLNIHDVFFPEALPEDFFENVKKWFTDNNECIEKLNILIQLEGNRFRDDPTVEGCEKIAIIENTVKSIKENANAELAVSNMFIKLGAMKFPGTR
ncbi:MAG: AAA family ATPase [Elusimicrobiota bacterium]